MSYYRPASLVAAQPIADLNAIASSSRLPIPPTILEDDGAVVDAKGKGKERKVRVAMNLEDRERWAARFCNVQPVGSCPRPQAFGSIYCTSHSCQAVNADGERCGNWVSNPRTSRFCASGWHMENSRHTHLSDMMAVRRMHDQVISADRPSVHAAQLCFIEQHFPSSSSSASPGSNQDASLPTSDTGRHELGGSRVLSPSSSSDGGRGERG